MPRGRGGARLGRPGESYTNRTDLNQPIRTAPSTSYGEATAQEEAQRAIPLPQMAPPDPGPFNRPTDRPAEPLTAGVPMGPGPDQTDIQFDPVAETLRAAFSAQPTPEIARLLERLR